MGYTWVQMGWIVLIYSCLGWCCEVAFAALKTGKFVNRGFLNGPVCPIYGFGVLSVVLVLEPVKDNLLLLFFGSMVFTSLLEFIAGFAMERIFHDKWWDYSNNPFNIKGYICLEFSIIWGIACVLVVDIIHPIIMKLVNALPHTLGLWLMGALYVLLVTDAVLTLVELLKLPKRFKAMEELEAAITAVSDAMGENIYDSVERGRQRSEAFNEKHPDIAEKSREYMADMLEKRSEINQKVKEREDANKEALAARKAELEAKLARLKGRNIVHRRIAKAYPQLLEGKNNGANFRKLKENWERRRNGENQ
ncbi:MAG: hypothetical protein SPE18_02545 [Candidatus Limivicinus sp.]|nr:hypothetical protein [Candidatus Limivicinus sp.]